MNPDEHAIRDLISRWHSATAAGDVEAVLSLMSEDAVFLTPGAPPMIGKAAFESGLRELLKGHRIRSSADVQEVHVSGDMAYTRTKLQVTIVATSGGAQNDRRGYTLSILRKQGNGKWLLTRDANLLAPA
jgi:uncharacterized protein (TIGR02246 family)